MAAAVLAALDVPTMLLANGWERLDRRRGQRLVAAAWRDDHGERHCRDGHTADRGGGR
jgi:hypothetical protein